jgi:pilus assembly protein CpaC
MLNVSRFRRARLAMKAAAALGLALAAAPVPVFAQPTVAPSQEVTLSVGTGRLIQLNGTMEDLFIANEGIADVQVRSNTSVYIFGKAAGQTTVYATDRAGRVIYSASVRVGQNLASVDQMLNLAMPEAKIVATPMNGLVLLTGTVAAPSDVEEAQRLTQAFVGDGTQVISRLRTATPQQVMLKVTIAEVSRTLTRDIGVNLQGGNGDFAFAQGRDFVGDNGVATYTAPGTTAVSRVLNVLGVSVQGAVDLREQNGLVTVLAEPNLTALSGETASFLAGGEFPIPVAQALGQASIEFRQYGVGLAFSPVVLENGRISMRVRPEVSELSSAGAVELNGFTVPSLTTRRAETTVELGSGQSFVIAGLLRNTGNNSVGKTPFLGNLPIIGALFRSNGFRREETELVIVVTPYLVQPVSANQIALPTDGFRTANDGQRLLLGKEHGSRSGETRPMPTVAPRRPVSPGIGAGGSAAATPQRAPVTAPATASAADAARPGFDF